MLHTESLIVGSSRTALILAKNLLKNGKKVVLVEQAEFGGSYLNSEEYPQDLLFSNIANYHKAQYVLANSKDTRKLYTQYRNQFFEIIKNYSQNQAGAILQELNSYSNFKTIEGRASFESESLIEINSSSQRHLITFDECFLCIGKNLLIPPKIAGLSGVKYLHRENLFKLQNWPTSIIFNEVTSQNLELVYNLALLGVKIYAIFAKKVHTVLNIDKALSDQIRRELEVLDVEIFESRKIFKVSKDGNKILAILNSNQSLLASSLYLELQEGFVDNDLNLQKAGIESDDIGIKVNSLGQTKNSKVRAFGSLINRLDKNLNAKEVFWNYINKLNNYTKFSLNKKVNSSDCQKFQLDNYYLQIGLDYKKAVDKYGPGIKMESLSLFLDSKCDFIIKPENKTVLGIVAIGREWQNKEALLELIVTQKWDIEKALNTILY